MDFTLKKSNIMVRCKFSCDHKCIFVDTVGVMYSYYIHYRFRYPMPIPIMFRLW